MFRGGHRQKPPFPERAPAHNEIHATKQLTFETIAGLHCRYVGQANAVMSVRLIFRVSKQICNRLSWTAGDVMVQERSRPQLAQDH